MANWKHKIILEGFSDSEPSDWPRLAVALRNSLLMVPNRLKDEDLENLLLDIEDLLRAQEDASADEFNEILSHVYDWGDLDYRLWIDTP
jgi:hypothetical protein